MPFKFLKARFNGDANVGLYGFATDDYCLLGQEPGKLKSKIQTALKTKVKVSTIAGTQFAGLFAVGNKNGLLLPNIVDDEEIAALKKFFDINIAILDSRETALGNLILCNDKGCLISEKLRKFRMEISSILDCDTQVGSIAGTDIIGSVAVANNKGCLCHIDATAEEMKKVEEILKVRTDVGTSGFGSPFIKGGIIVNSEGVVFSDTSTGPEIGRFEEVFS
jgi:translation initiation factor 6